MDSVVKVQSTAFITFLLVKYDQIAENHHRSKFGDCGCCTKHKNLSFRTLFKELIHLYYLPPPSTILSFNGIWYGNRVRGYTIAKTLIFGVVCKTYRTPKFKTSLK